jgi:hypothetical protein
MSSISCYAGTGSGSAFGRERFTVPGEEPERGPAGTVLVFSPSDQQKANGVFFQDEWTIALFSKSESQASVPSGAPDGKAGFEGFLLSETSQPASRQRHGQARAQLRKYRTRTRKTRSFWTSMGRMIATPIDLQNGKEISVAAVSSFACSKMRCWNRVRFTLRRSTRRSSSDRGWICRVAPPSSENSRDRSTHRHSASNHSPWASASSNLASCPLGRTS